VAAGQRLLPSLDDDLQLDEPPQARPYGPPPMAASGLTGLTRLEKCSTMDCKQ
jgi:hypothetical protein